MKMFCLVKLPNGTTYCVECDPKAIGQECLEKVCRDLGIVCETDYFGLLHNRRSSTSSSCEPESRTRQWINLRNPLGRHSNDGGFFMLALRVKFWVPAHLILQDSVRNVFYMQARQDLLENRLNASDWKNAAKLAALLAQADEVKFNPECLNYEKCPPPQYIFKHKDSNAFIDEAIFDDSKKERRRSSNRKSSELPLDTPLLAPKIDIPVTPWDIYDSYIIRPSGDSEPIPRDFLFMIAQEHSKLASLKMTSKSAKYWLLEEISKLDGFGEEIFNVPKGENVNQMDIAVGPHGLAIYNGDDKKTIPFSAVEAAKSMRRTFRLTYLTENHKSVDLEMKLPCPRTAASLYRAITEKHAFYSCETVRSAVTAQFIRDLKGTIISMFNEDTELGKRYVFDIQRTCREVHDNARRVLHSRGIDIQPQQDESLISQMPQDLDELIKAKENQKDLMEKEVAGRITEALTCRICMDKEIDTTFYPCGHVMSCGSCAKKCDRCPLCRANITTVNKIFLPTELRAVPMQRLTA